MFNSYSVDEVIATQQSSTGVTKVGNKKIRLSQPAVTYKASKLNKNIMMQLFDTVSSKCSALTTQCYSTSFSSAIKLLHKSMQPHIHNIYGFVRFADEIVDTFHEYEKATLLAEFKTETYKAIERKISLNPILNSFQNTVNFYKIDLALIDSFFKSMEFDLHKKQYDQEGYSTYIYGSAEVVGLMCLYVFCENNTGLYVKLQSYARSLGAAFQKINFLRDIKNDFENLDRVYFPYCDFKNFTYAQKNKIESDIEKNLNEAHEGILLLPIRARFGVYVAYKFYMSLFKKIKRSKPQQVVTQRIRIPNYGKVFILTKAGIRRQLNLL